MRYVGHAAGMLAVFCAVALAWSPRWIAAAPPAAQAAEADASQASLGAAAIRQALQHKITVSFAGQPFADLLSWLKQNQGLNVTIDAEQIDEDGRFDDLTITFAAQDQPLGTVLKRLLSSLDLAFDVRDDMLVITMHQCEPALELRAYDVRDLTAARGAFDEAEHDIKPLIEALNAAVLHGPWNDYGGGRTSALGGMLLVSQPAEVQQHCEWLLAALRQAKDRQRAKPGGEAIRVEAADAARVHQSIRRKLERPATVRFHEIPLADAVGTLRDVHSLPIELDMVRMHEVGEPGQLKVSLDVHDVPLRSILKRLLGRMGLAFVIREQTLLITTAERAAETLRTAVYPVRDLVEEAKASEGSDDGEAYENLADAIRGVAAPQTWEGLGGIGELHPVPGADALVCIQSDAVHAELAQMLETLRAARRLQQQAEVIVRNPAAGISPPGQDSASSSEKSPGELRTKVYKLQSGSAACADLVRLITEQIEPNSWRQNGAFASPMGESIVVRHTPAVQQMVGRLLRKLDALAPRNSRTAEPAQGDAEFMPLQPAEAPAQ